jgi:SAM-dependent methyltransferase
MNTDQYSLTPEELETRDSYTALTHIFDLETDARPNFIRNLFYRFLQYGFFGGEQRKVLDVACGWGIDAKPFIELGHTYCGIDFCPAIIEYARQHNPGFDFRVMDMGNLEFESGSFDFFFVSGCLYHVPKKKMPRILDEVKRVAAPHSLAVFGLALGSGETMEMHPDYKKRALMSLWDDREFIGLLEEREMIPLEIVPHDSSHNFFVYID